MRAVVFDMDGLMFNTEDVYTLAGEELLRRRGHEFTDELKRQMMGLRPQPAFERMIAHCRLKETWEQLAEESNRLFFTLLEGRLAMMPGLAELLDALERAGIPKAVCTSSSGDVVAACLRPFDLQGRFAFVLAAEDIVHGKPHPEIYLAAARRFRCRRRRCWCWRTAKTAAWRRRRRGRTSWPCRASTAGNAISAWPRCSWAVWPTGGST